MVKVDSGRLGPSADAQGAVDSTRTSPRRDGMHEQTVSGVSGSASKVPLAETFSRGEETADFSRQDRAHERLLGADPHRTAASVSEPRSPGTSLVETRAAEAAGGGSGPEGASPRRGTSTSGRARHGGVRQKNLGIEAEESPAMNPDQRAAIRRAIEVATRGADILKRRFSTDEGS